MITADSVAVVGEYTISIGPFGEDHFLVVVLRTGEILEYPAGKAETVEEALRDAIGVDVTYRLSNRTDEASRVIFPPDLAEHPLFEFRHPALGVLGILKLIRNFGIGETRAELTSEVQGQLGK